jgi:hypothetical protein
MTTDVTQIQWQIFYQNIKDPSWPDAPHVEDFCKLPELVQKEILDVHQARSFFCLDTEQDIIDFTQLYHDMNNATSVLIDHTLDQEIAIGDICVCYDQNLDGGGSSEYKVVLQALDFLGIPTQSKACLEWCSGPGFFGFALLAQHGCDYLYLNDCYEPAIQACRKTIFNLPPRYANRVTVLHTDSCANFPADIKFDLVIANPPHFPNWNFMLTQYNPAFPGTWNTSVLRREIDKNWLIHKNFFDNIYQYLYPGAKIVLLENIHGIGPWELESMIDPEKFKITRCFRFRQASISWYCEITAQ